jgi:hypothetical protein
MQLYVQNRREWEKSLREKNSLTSEEKHQRIRARQKQKQLQINASSVLRKTK